MKRYDLKFNSLTELSRFIETTPPKGVFKNATLQSQREGNESYYGTSNYQQADNLMLDGWEDGVKSVAAYMSKSNAGRRGQSPEIYNSFVGFAPCVPAYLSGNPLNMYNQKQAPNRKRIISITYNLAIDCSVSASQIQRAAAKLFNVIVGLEKQGVSTELYICQISAKNEELIFMSTCIKRAERPFNLLSAVYPFVNPSMLRRHGLAITERAGVRSKKWLSGYGRPISDIQETIFECKRVGIPTENVFNYDSLEYNSEEYIAKALK